MSRETLFVGGPFDGEIRILPPSGDSLFRYIEEWNWEEEGAPFWRENYYTLRHFMAANLEAPYDGSLPARLPHGRGAIVLDCWVAFAEGWE